MQIFVKGGRKAMNLATQTSGLSGTFGVKKSIEMIKEAGFDSVDFSMFCMSNDENILNTDGYADYIKNIKEFADGIGIKFSQAHAPYTCTLDNGEEYYIKHLREKAERAIEIAGMLEIPIIVVHPLQFRSYTRRRNRRFLREFNKEYYRQLIPVCEKTGVKIACENIWKLRGIRRKHIGDGACSAPEEFIDILDSVDSEYLTGCMDLGHCGLTGRKASDCLRALGGERIQALHVHDNDNVLDLHTAPGYGKMDWDDIAETLVEINYSGDITLEADNFMDPIADDYESCMFALKLMERIGRNFIEKIESYKTEAEK